MSFFDELFGSKPAQTATPTPEIKKPINASDPVATLTPTIKTPLATPATPPKPKTAYERGSVFIQDAEGFRDSPYLDTNGQLAIGYGQQFIDGKRVTSGMKITKEQAQGAFKVEYDRRRKQLDKYPNVANLKPGLEARLMDVVWNGDPSQIEGWPKIKAILTSNDPKELDKLGAELLTIRKSTTIDPKTKKKVSKVNPALEARRKRAEQELKDE
jgi:hypothetical protein